MLLLTLLSLALAEQIPNQNNSSHSRVWFRWKSTCSGARMTTKQDKWFKLYWLDDAGCVCVCVCSHACAHLTSVYLICSAPQGNTIPTECLTETKKVIDANVARGQEGNRANQLIKHFIRLVKPCGNFTASLEGNHSIFSASADNAVNPFW